MLKCIDITKSFHTSAGPREVLKGVNLKVERGEKVGILGRNGAGKSTILRIIGGVEYATSGRIEKDMSISWPLAFTGAFQGSLSGLDNLKFICRIYEKDYKTTRAFVDDFAELGSQILEPVKTYSSGMRARLGFALSLVIDFDCYLIDEVILVGDARFAEKCNREMFEKKSDRSMIIVSHDMGFVKETCTRCCLLQEGKMIECPSVEEGVDMYRKS